MGAYLQANFTPYLIESQTLFWVDVCSGQVKLRSGGTGVMDYEGVNRYIVTVRAFVSGFVGAEAIRNITVNVLNLDEPPVAVATAVTLVENAAAASDGSLYIWNDLSNFLAGKMQVWDPENSTVGYAVTVDGSSGRLVLNTTTGLVKVAASVAANDSSAVAFNYENLVNTFTLSVTVTQTNDTSMSSAASFVVTLVDANDAPVVTPLQVMSLSEYANSANPGSTQYPVLAGVVTAFDEDTNTSWNNGTSFSVVSGAPAGTACKQTSNWPTADGLVTGTPLFSVDSSTGSLTLTAMPPTGGPLEWRSRNPLIVDQQLLRALYYVCVRATDIAGASHARMVTVKIIADLPALPFVSDVAGISPSPPAVGGTTITFTGANFQPGGATLPLVAYYSNPRGMKYTGVGCSIVSNSSITCRTAPGFDRDYTWYLEIGGTAVTFLSTFTMSYADPVVTSLSANAVKVPTSGNTTISFFGSNFGPGPSQNPRSGGYTYNYSSPTLWFGNNGFEYTCLPVFYNDTVLQCSMPVGVGKDLGWTLRVGTADVTVAGGTTSPMPLAYLPPTITSVAGSTVAVDISRLDTYGGEYITITGTNFGPLSFTWRQDGSPHSPLTDPLYGQAYVKFGGNLGDLLPLVGCSQTGPTAHTTITCKTVPGVGVDHRVSVMIAGQPGNTWPTSASNSTSACTSGLCYLPPILASIAGTGATSADTVGGQLVVITGRHFGPVSFPIATIEYVVYGHAGGLFPSQYVAKSCSVTTQTYTVSQITCVTDEGVGRNLTWSVSVGGQKATNAGAPLTTSYAAPQVFTFSGTGSTNADTLGTQPVLVTGRNFGPADSYTSALLDVNYGVILQEGGVNFLTDIPFVRYIPASCTISIAHTQLTCITVPGAGRDMDWKVTVDSQQSSNPTTSYARPEIDTITALGGGASPVTAANVNGGDVLVLNGRHFGPPTYGNTTRSLLQAVTYGAVGIEFKAFSYVVVFDLEIHVTLPPGIGVNLRFVVTVADQASAASTGTFSYARPAIAWMSPTRASTSSPITSPTTITLGTRNLPLMDPTTLYRVTIGQDVFAVTKDISLPLMSLPAIAAKTNSDGTVNATFTLPVDGAGVGLGVQISVYQGTLSALAAETNVTGDNSVFSYADPVINTVIVTRALFWDGNGTDPGGDYIRCPAWSSPWSCSDTNTFQLTVQGANFGADPSTMDHNDGVTRKIELLTLNWTAYGIPLGEVWSRGSPGSPTDSENAIYLLRWSHNSLTAFARTSQGKLRVTMSTQSTYTQPRGASVDQSVMYDFASLNPTVSNLVGAGALIPTTGGVEPLVMTVDGLTGASDFKIFVGGDHTTGKQAIIVCPGAGTPSPLQPCPNIQTNIIQTASSGSADVTFFAPAGQGMGQPVVAVTYMSGNPKQSNSGFTVSYEPPKVTGFSILSNVIGAVWPSTTAVTPVSPPTITVPTDGSSRIRIFGTNLGTDPTVTLGDTQIVTSASFFPCDLPGFNHTCLEFFAPEGEGDGMLFDEYSYPQRLAAPFGYRLFVSAPLGAPYGQDSNPVKFSYEAPVVTSVASITGTYPTEGGVTVIVSGRNFGTHNDARQLPIPGSLLGITVTFINADNAGAPLDCVDVIRISHTALNCTLPEGSGRALNVIVSVAGLSGTSATPLFGYDKPVVTSSFTLSNETFVDYSDLDGTFDASHATGVEVVPGSNAQTSLLRASTEGGDFIVLKGRNFGRWEATSCAFMAWWNRDSAAVLFCDEQENFLGEGEVSASSVVYWSHTLVVFQANPGLGLKEIALSVGGNTFAYAFQSTSQAIRLRFNDPFITYLTPTSGPTEGKNIANEPTYITLGGSDFGPAPRDTRIPSNRLDGSTPARSFPVPLSVAPSLPTAYLVVVFHSSCVALAYDVRGAAVTDLTVGTANARLQLNGVNDEGCNQGFRFASSSGVSFQLPAGVGAGKNVSLVVIDAADASINQTSNVVSFSYFPPAITVFSPTPLFATWQYDNNAEKFVPLMLDVRVYGNDFGNYELAAAQAWGALERSIFMSVGGIPCLTEGSSPNGLVGVSGGITRTRETPRALSSQQAASPTTVVGCSLDFRTIPVGINNVTLTIAGQSDLVPSWMPSFPNETQIPGGSLILGCSPGSYAGIGETCRICPAQYVGTGLLPGATCAGYVNNDRVPYLQRFPYPRPSKGWYNMNSSDANTHKWGNDDPLLSPALECPPGFQDGDRDVCIVPCDPPESCLGDNFCSYGYASKPPMYRCSSCDTGFYRQGYACVKCPDSPWALVIGFTLLVIFAGGVGYLLNQKNVNIAVISIGLDFFQVLAIFATSGVKWPPVVKELLHILSAFNLNIEIVAPECIVPDLGYKQKFWFIMLLPLSVGGLLLGGVWTSLYLFKRFIKGQNKKDTKSHTPALVASVLSLLYILYLYLTRTVFDVFTCNPTYPPDGRTYMNVANREQCGVPGGTQLVLLPYAVAGLIVYSFGYPAFVGAVLFKNRELAMLDQILRAKGVGDDRLTNPHAFKLRATFGRAYFQFKPDWCMWMLAIILRKFLIAITAVVFSKNSSFQMAACLLVMFLAYSAQVMVRPFLGPAEYDEVLRSHTESSFTSAIHARIRAGIASIETRGRKKVRKNLLNFEGKVDKAAILGVLTGWLFNYNTIEQIMIFCAVIVCLMGIMYQANSTTSFYPGALDGVTAVVMITIIFAIVYYLVVVITEMVVLYNEESAKKRAKNASRVTSAKRNAKTPDSPKGGSGGGRLVTNEGEINTGKLDNQMNPLFMNKGGDGLNTDSVTGVEAIMAQRTPPPADLWLIIQQSYISINKQLEESNAVLADTKKQLQLQQSIASFMDEEFGSGGSGGSGSGAGGAPSSPPMHGKKKAFAPQGMSSGAAGAPGSPGSIGGSNPLNSFRSAGGNRASLKSQRKVASPASEE